MAKSTQAPQGPRYPLGKEAFQQHLATVSKFIMIGLDTPQTREAAQALWRARQWAQAGDYLSALHAIGALTVSLDALPGAREGSLTAGQVEQALGDLRRAIGRSAERDGTAQAQALWAAAREEVVRGSWEAAMALISEAQGWLEGPR